MKKKNQEFLEDRIEKLSEEKKDKKDKKDKSKTNSDEIVLLSNKETEDLFKIAFRNYNHLISVADSKASLLINVNSIIISVMIAFVLGKIDKLFFILWPTIILLAVCLGTILLAILASRPQSNSFLENRSSLSYQRFSLAVLIWSIRNLTGSNGMNTIRTSWSCSVIRRTGCIWKSIRSLLMSEKYW
jgi:hypothetical protein